MKQLAFLGGKDVGARCLRIAIDRADALGFRIAAVIPTPRGQAVRQLAMERGLPLLESLDLMPECDLLISVQFDQILQKGDIEKARELAVNLHMAPLPEYRGCNQFSLAIINDNQEFGVTLHQLTEGIDEGPIISERRFPLPDTLWVDELVSIAVAESERLFDDTLEPLVTGQITLTDQASLVNERGTTLSYRKDIDRLKVLDLSWDADRLNRYIRALSMPGFEPPYAILRNGDKVFFSRGATDD